MDQPVTTPSDLSEREGLRLSWREPAGMLGLSMVNFLLRIVTLGIYNFWGKTEVRKRLWSSIRIDGEPLQYTGTGRELFLGFLIAFLVFIMPIMVISTAVAVAFGPESSALYWCQIGFSILIFFLTGLAIYRAQRYRLSRTRWRGIRGALVGKPGTYAQVYFWTGVLIPLTAGWIVPWRSTKLQEIITRETRFGSEPLRFSASSAPLYGPFALLWLGMAVVVVLTMLVVAGLLVSRDGEQPALRLDPETSTIMATIGAIALGYAAYSLLGAWYHARQINHFAAHTHLDEATFKGTVTGWGLIWIGLSNILIVAFSLGLLIPVAQVRAARYLIQHLELIGPVAVDAIGQGADQGIARGEGLAQAFDVGPF